MSDGEGYVASYATAVPKNVIEFMRLMHKEVTEDGTRQVFDDALYYVGPPTAELDAHVFEWGYGWTVAVPPDKLQVSGSPARGGLPPLFHGDRVAAAGFVAVDDGDPVMVIAWRDVFPRYVTQIVEERRLQYLHLLDVEVGLDTGTLRVMRAQASRRRGRTRSAARSGCRSPLRWTTRAGNWSSSAFGRPVRPVWCGGGSSPGSTTTRPSPPVDGSACSEPSAPTDWVFRTGISSF